MFISDGNGYARYAVVVEKFAEWHYIKKFQKKYREKKWRITQTAIEAVCANPKRAIEREEMQTITDTGEVLICKYDFAVAGTKQSRKKSGNRVILAVHKQEKISRILLVYHKNDLKKGNETQQWKKLIRGNYSLYRNII